MHFAVRLQRNRPSADIQTAVGDRTYRIHRHGDDSCTEAHEFTYENDLKNFLASNLDVIRATIKVYQDGDLRGVEFPVGNRRVDILAVEDEKDFVVIELKVSKGYDRAIGQLLWYTGWIEQNLAEPDQKVKGMI